MVKHKCEQIQSLFQKLAFVASRDLLSELYPYLWDIKEITNMLSNIIRGFEAGKSPQKRGVPSNMRPSVSHGGIVTLLQVGRDETGLPRSAAFSLTALTACARELLAPRSRLMAAFFSNDAPFLYRRSCPGMVRKTTMLSAHKRIAFIQFGRTRMLTSAAFITCASSLALTTRMVRLRPRFDL